MFELECPICHFTQHCNNAIYCQSCGNELPLLNKCLNPNCDSNNGAPISIPNLAKYCPYCGSKTQFFNENNK